MHDNLHFLDDSPPKNCRVTILPIPSNLGSPSDDARHSPRYLKQLGIETALKNAGIQITTHDTISVPKKPKDKPRNIALARILATQIRERTVAIIERGERVLALGGDHSIAIGTISGAAQVYGSQLGVIWIDAHGDIHTTETSASKNMHAVPAAAVLGLDATLKHIVTHPIKKSHMLHIGLKDIDLKEIAHLRKHKLAAVTMNDIASHGLSVAIKKITQLSKRVKYIWVSMDMDSIDEADAPGVAMSSRGGFTYREITNLMTYIGKTMSVVGMDIVEISPEKDIDQKTGMLAIELSAYTFGAKHNWYTSYMKKQTN